MGHSNILIYGKVETIDGDSYEGQIRWGKEEAFWFDHFNSSKPENENLDLLSSREIDNLDRNRHNNNNSWMAWRNNWFSSNNNSWGNNHTHSFACEFGDIKRIEPGRGERIRVTLQNGDVLRMDGGSNDVGASVRVYDEEQGLLKIAWDNIETVDFFNAPRSYQSKFGQPLYGTVLTSSGSFSGYVQWDHDERLSDDELNGDIRGGELDLPFRKIKTITKTYRGVEVEVLSGRRFDMSGSNDVNNDNRGIIVNIAGMGRVDIPWEEFESVTFTEVDDNRKMKKKSSYSPKKISGTVITVSGKKYAGELIYDLDETYNIEILNGKYDEMEFFLPFREIKTIRPKSDDRSMVKLENGKELLLEDSVDVSDDNDGIIVSASKNNYEYIPWSEVEEVRIN